MKENMKKEDLQSSEWNFINATDEKPIDEPSVVKDNNIDLNTKSTVGSEHIDQNSGDNDVLKQNGTWINHPWRTISACIILFFGLQIVYGIYNTYKLENMIGDINDFSSNSNQIKAAFEKCKQQYMSNEEILESCLQSKINPSSCLDYYTALLNKNKDFCKWNVASILKEKRQLINDPEGLDFILDIGSKTKEMLLSTKEKADLVTNELTNKAKSLIGENFEKTSDYIQKLELKDQSKIAFDKIQQNLKSYSTKYGKKINEYDYNQKYLTLKEKLARDANFISNEAKKQITNFRRFWN